MKQFGSKSVLLSAKEKVSFWHTMDTRKRIKSLDRDNQISESDVMIMKTVVGSS